MNCPVWLCIWPMPTHGGSLSSGSIDALTMKDDSACLAPRKGGEDGLRSPCVCVSVSVCLCMCACFVFFWPFAGARASVVRACACVCLHGSAVVKLDGKERSLKDRRVCQHGYCCTVTAISIQLLSLTLRAKPQKPLLSPSEKSLYSPPEGTVHWWTDR